MIEKPALLRLCVVTAASIEFKTVAKLLHGAKQSFSAGLPTRLGHFGCSEVTLLKSEIGAPGFVKKLQCHVAANRYDALLIIGLGGALDPSLKTGDVVIYDRCLDARLVERNLPAFFPNNRKISPPRDEFASIPCNATLGGQLLRAVQQSGLRSKRGAGALVERVITKAHQKELLSQQTQALAVDMETWLVLAALAPVTSLPCAAFRVVLDEARSDLPDFNTGLSAAGQMRCWPTLRALAARPRASGQFLFSLLPALRSLKQATQAVLTGLANR
jgi:nucleoside phosphorylase